MVQPYLRVLFSLWVCLTAHTVDGLNRESYNARTRIVALLTNKSTAKEFLPVVDRLHNVTVNISLTIQRIATVDEVNQAIRLIVWLRISWINVFLTWNPRDYNNISSIHLDNELIWKPDLALYNKASLEEEIDILYKRMTTAIVVKSNGHCQWNSPATLLSQCKIDVSDFPFDEQICKVIMGSWTYTGDEIDVAAPEKTAYLESFAPSGEWDIVEAPMKRNAETYAAGVYPDVTLYLRIKRRPLYFTMNLIIPCTMISILSFLCFVLPTNNGERISLVITVLLAMSVYMLIVSSTLPQTSDAVPRVGIYFLCTIVEISFCLLATCFVARIRECEREIPKWLDHVVNKKLAALLFMKMKPSEYSPEQINASYENNLNAVTVVAECRSEDKKEKNDSKAKVEVCFPVMDKIVEELSVITADVAIRQKRCARVKKWHNTASVLDRFFLVVFILIFGILTAACFSR